MFRVGYGLWYFQKYKTKKGLFLSDICHNKTIYGMSTHWLQIFIFFQLLTLKFCYLQLYEYWHVLWKCLYIESEWRSNETMTHSVWGKWRRYSSKNIFWNFQQYKSVDRFKASLAVVWEERRASRAVANGDILFPFPC